MGEIRSLTSLRFVAALWVFVFHIDLRWGLPLPPAAHMIVRQGPVGMSLFFILSGYVLGYSHIDGIASFSTYAKRRFARIYPVYLFTALITLPFFTVAQVGWRGFVEGAFVVLSNILMIQAWFPPLFTYWNDGGSWSLSAEAFFYAMFPMILGVMRKSTNRQLLLLLAGAYVMSVLPGISYVVMPNSKQIFYALPIFRFPEFVVGVSCAMLVHRGFFKLRYPNAVGAACIAALVVFLLLAPPSDSYVTANVCAVPAIAGVIICLTQIQNRVFEHKIPVTLGRASYAFYSMQQIVFLTMITFQKDHTAWPSVPTLCLSFFVLQFLALAVFFFIEEPMRRLLTRKTTSHQAFGASPSASIGFSLQRPPAENSPL